MATKRKTKLLSVGDTVVFIGPNNYGMNFISLGDTGVVTEVRAEGFETPTDTYQRFLFRFTSIKAEKTELFYGFVWHGNTKFFAKQETHQQKEVQTLTKIQTLTIDSLF